MIEIINKIIIQILHTLILNNLVARIQVIKMEVILEMVINKIAPIKNIIQTIDITNNSNRMIRMNKDSLLMILETQILNKIRMR